MRIKKQKVQSHSWAVLLVAAGESKRLKSKVSKPFLELDGKHTLLDASLSTFKKISGLAYVIIVTRRNYLRPAWEALQKTALPGVVTLGGNQREDSVWNGLQRVPSEVKTILIHDAARPLVSPRVIHRVLRATEKSGAAIPVVPVKDTLKKVMGNKVVETLDRSIVRAVQTPQGFRVEILKKAFLKLGPKASGMTDDASLVEVTGQRVEVVEGESINFKVTFSEDLERARDLWSQRKH